jgi:hypothetical protein
MTVIPVFDDLIDETYNAVKLARFAQRAGYAEAQFFGINDPDTQEESCQPIWRHRERAQLAHYLAEAQAEIEQLVRYPLYPKWFVNEQHYYTYPLHSDWGKIIEIGYRHKEMIHAGMSLVYVADPVAFFHATTETDEGNIRVFHPGTDIEIIPSYVQIAGGNVLIEVPWARLVKDGAQHNPANGWDYADVPPSASSPYTATVDIASVHNNTDIEAGLVWPHKADVCCTGGCDCCPTCAEYTETACVYVRNYETGALDILPATYSAGGWTSALCSSCYCTDPQLVRINYRAGLTELTADLEEAIIMLALAKLPSSPCGCGPIADWWKAANEPVDSLTLAFGMRKAGALKALDIVNKNSMRRGMVIG